MTDEITATPSRRSPVRQILFAVALAVAGILVAFGAAVAHPAAGLIVAGVMVAGWSWLVLGEVR